MKLQEGMKCPICGGGVLEQTRKDHEIDYNGQKQVLSDMDVYVCNSCEDGFYSRNSERQINIAFADMKRTAQGLLTTDEIKDIRQQNNLTQEQLSKLLGMATKTIARYENGSIVQSRSTDVLLRLIRDNPTNIEYLDNYLSSVENSSFNSSDKIQR